MAMILSSAIVTLAAGCDPHFTKVGSSVPVLTEVVKFDKTSNTFFATADGMVKQFKMAAGVLDPTPVSTQSFSDFGSANSLDASHGILAVAVGASNKQDPGRVYLYTTSTSGITPYSMPYVTVGALPDMVIFTSDGSKLLTANEGEPSDDYTNDPDGSVSIITLATGAVVTATFNHFTPLDLPAGVRTFGPNAASVSKDMEPEFIAISPDDSTAYVTCQENNAIAVLDIASAKFISILNAGTQDWSVQELDPSDKDDEFRLRTLPAPAKINSLNQPDAIVSFVIDNVTYYAAANEGDAREYSPYEFPPGHDDEGDPICPADQKIGENGVTAILGFCEEARLGKVDNLPDTFHSALLEKPEFGRLKTTLYPEGSDPQVVPSGGKVWGFGGRGFSIFANGASVYDSRDSVSKYYKSSRESSYVDERSDDKGPEPEGLTVGKMGAYTFLFVAMERTNDIFIYDVSVPTAPQLMQVIADAGDYSPEGLDFVPASDSPTGKPMLVIGYEWAPDGESPKLALYEASNTCAGPSAPWCNSWTCWSSSCTYYPACVELNQGRKCSKFCSKHTCHLAHCFGCDFCN